MKKIITLSVLHICILYSATAQTNVSGFINANTTWTVAGSPYIVIGNALLSHGYTLTIDPGVLIKFNTNTALQIDGELHAVGTAANRITFTSNQSIPDSGDWAKIHFADTCENALFDANENYLSGCIMKYCDIMYAGGLGFGAIHIDASSPYISQCNILYSSVSGIYCAACTYRLDSSTVKNCSGYGLSFFNPLDNIKIISDSIAFNQGGIQMNRNLTYTVLNLQIRNNVFFSNTYGAIDSDLATDSMVISDNHFINNTASINAISLVGLHDYNTDYVIECNKFYNNQTTGPVLWLEEASTEGNYVRYNAFVGNSGGYNIVNVSSLRDINSVNHNFYFVNNYISNNSTAGQTCRFTALAAWQPLTTFNILDNEITGNTATSTVYFDLGPNINNSNIDFVNIKRNNFNDPNSQYEFYNNVPYGSPNLYADSNYWGSTSTQHIDSVIYDYFDFANQSVVYYLPILISPATIDTTCLNIITGGIEFPNAAEKDAISGVYPNPFAINATVSFGKEVHNATFSLYNLLGEKVKTFSEINGKNIRVDRENLQSGIYIFEVIEKGNRIGRGKAVVY